MFYKPRNLPTFIRSESAPKPPLSVFDGVRHALATFLDNPEVLDQALRPNLLFINAFLNKDSVRDYFLWYVNSPLFAGAVVKRYQEAFIPRHDGNFKVVTEFREKGSVGVRYESTHSLTEKEYMVAYDYLNTKNKAMLMAAYVLEQAMLAYVEALETAYPTLHPNINKPGISLHAESAYIQIEAPATSKAIMEEFITTFALPAAQNQSKPVAAGLRLAFGKHNAFETSNGNVIRTCPFKSPFAHLLNMTLIQDESGEYHAGEAQHGGLILSLMDIIKNWEQSPPAHKIAHDII